MKNCSYRKQLAGVLIFIGIIAVGVAGTSQTNAYQSKRQANQEQPARRTGLLGGIAVGTGQVLEGTANVATLGSVERSKERKQDKKFLNKSRRQDYERSYSRRSR